MTVLARVNYTSQMRLDLTHVLAGESFGSNDFRSLTAFFTGLANVYVVSGLAAIGKSGLTITLKVAGSVIFNPMDSAGAFYFSRPDDADVNIVLPASTANVYVQARFATLTQAPVNQAYWNPLAITGDSAAGDEFTASTDSQVITTLEISTNSFGFTDGYIPILKCETQASSIVNIVDCRPLFFRLGTGGATPDPFHAFPWSATRAEPVYQGSGVGQDVDSPFRSTDLSTIKNDKGIETLKEWMDAVMTRLGELAGSPLWYDNSILTTYVSNLNLSTAFFDSDAGHSIDASESTTLIWKNNHTLCSEGTAPVIWRANFGGLTWMLGGTFVSPTNRAYSDTKFVSPVVGDGNNLYLALQREVQMGSGADVSWKPALSPWPGTIPDPAWSIDYSIGGLIGDFTGIAVGDYVRKSSQGMSQYHKVVGITDGLTTSYANGAVATSSTIGLLLDSVVTASVESLRYFRSRYSNADLFIDSPALIYNTDYMWLGRRTGQFFMLRGFGTLTPGEEVTIFDNNKAVSGDSGSPFFAIDFGADTAFSNVTSKLDATNGTKVFQIVKRRKDNFTAPTSDNTLGKINFTLTSDGNPTAIPVGSSLWASLPDGTAVSYSAGQFHVAPAYAADLVNQMPVILTSPVGFPIGANAPAADTLYYVRNISGSDFDLYTAAIGGSAIDGSLIYALGGLEMVYLNTALSYSVGSPAHDPLNGPHPKGALYILTAAQTATEEFDFNDLYLIATRVESLPNSFVMSTIPGLLFFDGTVLTIDGQFIENGLAVHGATSVFGGLKDSYVTTPVFLGDNNTYGTISSVPANNTAIDQSLMAPGKSVETILGGLNAAILSQSDETNTGFISWVSSPNPTYYTVGGGNFTVVNAGYGRIKGRKVEWAGGQSVSIPANNTSRYIYVDVTGTLHFTVTANAALYQNNIVLFEVFADSAGNILVVKENHPYAFNTAASTYLHNNVGTVIRGVGADVLRVTTGTGALATDRQLMITSSDFIEDHGLISDIPAINPINWQFVYTNVGGAWTEDGSPTPNFTPRYNLAGVLTALDQSPVPGTGDVGVFTLYVAKDDLINGPLFVAVYDTNKYDDISGAQLAIDAGTTARISGSLASLEFAQLGYVLYQNNALTGYIDQALVVKSTFNSKVVGGGNQGFAGLVATTSSNFDAMLSGSDATVQEALETIDDYAKDAFFKVQNVVDATKLFKMDVSGVSTATTSKAQIPNPGMVSVGVGDIILGSTVKPLASGSYLLTKYDRVVATGLSVSAPTDLTLPLAPTNGSMITIKDVGLTASKYPVTVSASGTETIEECPGLYVLCEDGVSVIFEYNQGNWAVRAPSRVAPEAKQTTATAAPAWDSVDIGYESIATSTTTSNTVVPLDLGSTKGRALELIPGDYVQGLVFKKTSAFTGVTTLGMQVGDSAVVDKFLASVNVMPVAGGKTSKPASMSSLLNASQIAATFTGDVALNNLTTGAVQLNVLKSNLIGLQGSRNQPSWKKFVINYRDVITLGAVLTGTLTLPVKFSGSCVTGVAVRSTVAFTGLTTPTCTVKVGPTSTVTAFSPTVAGSTGTYDIFQMTGPRVALSVTVDWASANYFTNATSGELEVYIQVSQYEGQADNLYSLSTVVKNPSATPTWQKFSVASSAFGSLVAATPKTLNVCPIYGDEIVHAIFMKHSIPFAGAGMTSIQASVGDGALNPPGLVFVNSVSSYMPNFDVKQAVGDSVFPTPYSTVIFNKFDSSSRMLQVTITADASAALSAGLLDIYVLKSKLASK